MGKVGQRNDRSKKGVDGKGKSGFHHKGKSNFPPNRHKKVEITFNPTDRRDYLTGFSSRKKERRAFGLAMQKVKDRQAKLEERKEKREAQLEKIEDVERNKVVLRKGISIDDGSAAGSDDGSNSQLKSQQNEPEMKMFQDEHTTTHFGGLVSVTTTFGIPSDDDGDSVNSQKSFYARNQHGSGHVDQAQKQAGSVHNYISTVKGTLGNKKKRDGSKTGGKKGQHGASSMKGMGNGSSLKLAKKTLSKFKAKGGKNEGDHERRGGSGSSRGKKRKRR